jgi:hypothetical protein
MMLGAMRVIVWGCVGLLGAVRMLLSAVRETVWCGCLVWNDSAITVMLRAVL